MNYAIFSAINGLAGHVAVLDAFMVFAANWLIWPFLLAGAVVTGLAARQDGWPAAAWRVGQCVVTLGVAFAFSLVLKQFHLSIRPFQSHKVTQLIPHAPGVSLPSDHATACFAVAIAIWFFVSKRWGPWFLAVAVLVAFSRVYVGVHYPADVTAGALLGVIAGLIVWGLTIAVRERMETRRLQEVDDPSEFNSVSDNSQ